jgi:rod shape determining protein RodA
MQISLRSQWNIDWLSLSLTMLIACIGLMFVFSATYSAEHHFSLYFKKQAIGFFLGSIVYWTCMLTDYRTLQRWGYFGYYFVIALLIYTLIKGSIGMGAQRWINLIIFKFQPSELAKPLFPAFVSYYLYTHPGSRHSTWTHFIPLLAMLGISFILILKQPDLGTALIIAMCGLTLLWLAGLSKKFFIYGALACFITAPLLWKTLKPYQKNRIAVFLGYGATNKERYQIEQATIAVGSGGLFGKGFSKGTQNRLQFLPESRTDFIFAVICEEWGLLGAYMLLALYALLCIRTLFLIPFITSLHAQLLAIGLLLHIILSSLINIAMVLGLLPIVGIPLPLVSYGLSNLLISFASLGWIQGIYLQRSER